MEMAVLMKKPWFTNSSFKTEAQTSYRSLTKIILKDFLSRSTSRTLILKRC